MAVAFSVAFAHQPAVREIDASGDFLLIEDWFCLLGREGQAAKQGMLLSLPAGVQTDFASVPKVLHWLIDQCSLGTAAPLVHDVCYQTYGILPKEWFERTVTREEADRWLYELALASKAPRWKAWAAWKAVRMFAPRW